MVSIFLLVVILVLVVVKCFNREDFKNCGIDRGTMRSGWVSHARRKKCRPCKDGYFSRAGSDKCYHKGVGDDDEEKRMYDSERYGALYGTSVGSTAGSTAGNGIGGPV